MARLEKGHPFSYLKLGRLGAPVAGSSRKEADVPFLAPKNPHPILVIIIFYDFSGFNVST